MTSRNTLHRSITAEAVNARATSSVVLTWVFALLPANFAPPIIEGLAGQYGMEIGSAGMVVTGMTVVNAIAVLACRRQVARGRRVLFARIGIAILTLAFLIGSLFPSATSISAALIIGGIGSGIAIATATASASATRDPDRTSQLSIMVNRVVLAAGFLLLPLLGGSIGSVFVFTAVMGVLAFAGCLWLPQAPAMDRQDETIEGAREVRDSAGPRARDPLPDLPNLRRVAWALALSFAAYTVTEEGTYGLIQVLIMTNVPEMPPEAISMVFAGAVIAGLVGAICAPVLMRFLGRTVSVGLLLTMSLLAKIGLVFATDTALYVTASVGWGFTFGALMPLIFGFAARLQRNGSVVVLLNGIYIFGVALGPLVSTQLVQWTGFGVFGVAFAIFGTIAAVGIVASIMQGNKFLASQMSGSGQGVHPDPRTGEHRPQEAELNECLEIGKGGV